MVYEKRFKVPSHDLSNGWRKKVQEKGHALTLFWGSGYQTQGPSSPADTSRIVTDEICKELVSWAAVENTVGRARGI